MIELTHGSLFSGIGGFELAAHWCGIKTLWQVEQDKYCQQILKKRFPEAELFNNIKDVGKKELKKVSIISGGFPCQPFSVAGKQRGQSDDRFLWPEMLRIIREVRPSYVIGENVPGIVKLALDEVLSSLEDEGYTTETFSITASALGAWHKRERIWILAYPNESKQKSNIGSNIEETEEIRRENEGDVSARLAQSTNAPNSDNTRNRTLKYRINKDWPKKTEKRKNELQPEPGRYSKDISNTTEQRWIQIEDKYRIISKKVSETSEREFGGTDSISSNVPYSKKIGFQRTIHRENQRSIGNEQGQVPVEGSSLPISGQKYWEFEPDVGRVANGIPNRVDRLKCLGNAIVPQVAHEIFKAIIQIENDKKQYS